MSTSFGDLFSIVRYRLESDTTIYDNMSQSINAAVAGQIISAQRVNADFGTIPRPNIVMEKFGGSREYSDAIGNLTVYLYVFADNSSGQGDAIYHALYKSLQGTRLYDPTGSISTVAAGREVTSEIEGINNPMKTWYVRGIWNFNII